MRIKESTDWAKGVKGRQNIVRCFCSSSSCSARFGTLLHLYLAPKAEPRVDLERASGRGFRVETHGLCQPESLAWGSAKRSFGSRKQTPKPLDPDSPETYATNPRII